MPFVLPQLLPDKVNHGILTLGAFPPNQRSPESRGDV